MMSLVATCLFMVLMCLGLPIAASLGLAAGAVIWWYDLPLAVIAQRTVNSLDSTPLLAVPMFIFAASIFNTAGITQHLFDFIRMIVGRIRGGLGYVTILTHLIFSGISGAALADIGALGSIQIRMMRQQGYKDEFSAGICMAASTSLAFRSFILAWAMLRTCSLVTTPLKSRPGAFEPESSFAAFLRK